MMGRVSATRTGQAELAAVRKWVNAEWVRAEWDAPSLNELRHWGAMHGVGVPMKMARPALVQFLLRAGVPPPDGEVAYEGTRRVFRYARGPVEGDWTVKR
jgi:hypothetical protein